MSNIPLGDSDLVILKRIVAEFNKVGGKPLIHNNNAFPSAEAKAAFIKAARADFDTLAFRYGPGRAADLVKSCRCLDTTSSLEKT
jgi:hypothetical protein